MASTSIPARNSRAHRALDTQPILSAIKTHNPQTHYFTLQLCITVVSVGKLKKINAKFRGGRTTGRWHRPCAMHGLSFCSILSSITHTCRQHSSLIQSPTQKPSCYCACSSRCPPQPPALPSYPCHPSHRQHLLSLSSHHLLIHLPLGTWEPLGTCLHTLNHPSINYTPPGTHGELSLVVSLATSWFDFHYWFYTCFIHYWSWNYQAPYLLNMGRNSKNPIDTWTTCKFLIWKWNMKPKLYWFEVVVLNTAPPLCPWIKMQGFEHLEWSYRR